MKQTLRSVLLITAAASMLTACAQQGRPGAGVMNGGDVNKADVGTLVGAGLGAWAGSNVGGGKGRYVGTAIGTLLGAGLGRSVGQSLDNADMAAYNQTSQRALETAQPGQALPWKGPNASGTVTPSNYYKNDSGMYCREYTQEIKVGGKTEKGYGTACRQPDGSWQVVQ